MSPEERQLLTEVRDLLREALPILKGQPTEEQDPHAAERVRRAIAMSSPDPAQALRELGKRQRSEMRQRRRGKGKQ